MSGSIFIKNKKELKDLLDKLNKNSSNLKEEIVLQEVDLKEFEEVELNEFTVDQISKLAKSYADLAGKTMSMANVNKLRKIFDKIPDSSLNDLRKKKIPFISGLALSRMIQKKMPVTEDMSQGFVVKFTSKKDGKIGSAWYKAEKDAKEFLSKLKSDGGNGVISKNDGKYFDETTDEVLIGENNSMKYTWKDINIALSNTGFSPGMILKVISALRGKHIKEETLIEFTDKQITMAKGIAFDKRYKDGNMTKAVEMINKIAKGLSDNSEVANALRQANEEVMSDKDKETKKEGGPPVDGGPGSGAHNKDGTSKSGDKKTSSSGSKSDLRKALNKVMEPGPDYDPTEYSAIKGMAKRTGDTTTVNLITKMNKAHADIDDTEVEKNYKALKKHLGEEVKEVHSSLQEVSDNLKLAVLKRKIKQYKDRVFKKTMSTIKSPLFANKDKDLEESFALYAITSFPDRGAPGGQRKKGDKVSGPMTYTQAVSKAKSMNVGSSVGGTKRVEVKPLKEADLEEGKMSDIHNMVKDGKSAEEIAKALKLNTKTLKDILGEVREANNIPATDKKEPTKEPTEKGEPVEKQLNTALAQVSLLKQKLENEKNKAVKPKPNPITGEVPLTVGIAHAEFKKEKEKEVKEKVMYTMKEARVLVDLSVAYKNVNNVDEVQVVVDVPSHKMNDEMYIEDLAIDRAEELLKQKKIGPPNVNRIDTMSTELLDFFKTSKPLSHYKATQLSQKEMKEVTSDKENRVQRAKDMIKYYDAQKKAALKGKNKDLAKKMLKNEMAGAANLVAKILSKKLKGEK